MYIFIYIYIYCQCYNLVSIFTSWKVRSFNTFKYIMTTKISFQETLKHWFRKETVYLSLSLSLSTWNKHFACASHSWSFDCLIVTTPIWVVRLPPTVVARLTVSICSICLFVLIKVYLHKAFGFSLEKKEQFFTDSFSVAS